MTKEEKFHKILKVAEQNGFKIDKSKFINHEDAPPVMALLFNKAFAKAIFGDYIVKWCEKECRNYKKRHFHVGSEFRLKEAIMSDEPIDYYYENLPQENPAFWDDTLETVIEDEQLFLR